MTTTEPIEDQEPASDAPPRFSALDRRFLRFAGVHRPDVVTHSDRVLYGTIGFFVAFFGFYGFLAFYAFFARAGLVEIGPPGAGIALTALAAGAIAVAITLFDRSIVAQVSSSLHTLRPRRIDIEDDSGELADALLHPIGRRRRAPFVGRLVIAFVIGFFATQSIEVIAFSDDIAQQRAGDRIASLTRELEDNRRRQATAHEEHEATRTALEQQAESAAEAAARARRGTAARDCRKGSSCEQRLRASNKAYAALTALGPDPSASTSEYGAKQAALERQIAALEDGDASALPDEPHTALSDTWDLYRFMWGNPGSLVYYVCFTLLLLAIDLAALLLKYFVAKDTEYERRQAARQRVRWQATAARHELEVRAEHQRAAQAALDREEEAKTAAEAIQADHALRRKAFERSVDSPVLAREAAGVAEDHVAARLHAAPLPHGTRFVPPVPGGSSAAAEVEDELAALASGTRPGESPAELHRQGDAPSAHPVFEILGAAAGLTVLAYLFGGLFLFLQFHETGLPGLAVLAAMPGRAVVSTGAFIVAIAVLPVGVFILVTRRSLTRLSDKVAQVPEHLGVHWRAALGALWAAPRDAAQRLLRRERRMPTGAAPDPSRPTPGDGADPYEAEDDHANRQELVGGAAALAAAPIGAWEVTNSVAAVTVTGATSAAAVLLILLVLHSIGNLDPNSRTFRAWVLGIASMVTVVGVFAYTQFTDFRLPRATIRYATNDQCIKASYLASDPAGVTLVDGAQRALRVVPARAIADISVSTGSFTVVETTLTPTACPAGLTFSKKPPRG